MSYCLNPQCPQPQNHGAINFCETCGSKLLLKERYRGIKPIGRGGFGRTFLAVDEDKPSKPSCVIKQFAPATQGTGNMKKAEELFAQEAVRLDQLGKHPQIPDLFAYFTQDGQQYLILEFIDGSNLAQELASQGVFNETKILELLKNLLTVMQFVHENQVIHRDIKPENIIRRGNVSPSSQLGLSRLREIYSGQLVLVDFGAAKVLTGGENLQTGTSIGSAEYVAPEQLRGKAIFASDIYSLGVTCIHLLTDMSPFDLFDIYQNSWVWRDYLYANPLSKKLGKILDKMLCVNPTERYRSVAEILTDLGENNPVPLVATPTPIPNRVNSQPAVKIPPQIQTEPPASKVPQNQPKSKQIKPVLPPLVNQVPTWKCRSDLTGHLGAITSLAFSPDGHNLASGSQDKRIDIWRWDTGKWWYSLTGHQDWVTCLAFSPDGQTLASGSRDKTIEMWQFSTGKRWYTLVGHTDGVESIAFNGDSQILVSGSRDNTIGIWNLKKAKRLFTLTGHTDKIYSVAVQGDLIASGSRDQTIKLWNLTNGQQMVSMSGHTDWVRSLVFSPPSSHTYILVSGGRDGTIRLWLMEGQKLGQLTRTWQAIDDILCLAMTSDGQLLASGKVDGTILLWDVSTGNLLEILKGHKGEVFALAFSPDGQTLVSGGADKMIKIWRR